MVGVLPALQGLTGDNAVLVAVVVTNDYSSVVVDVLGGVGLQAVVINLVCILANSGLGVLIVTRQFGTTDSGQLILRAGLIVGYQERLGIVVQIRADIAVLSVFSVGAVPVSTPLPVTLVSYLAYSTLEFLITSSLTVTV